MTIGRVSALFLLVACGAALHHLFPTQSNWVRVALWGAVYVNGAGFSPAIAAALIAGLLAIYALHVNGGINLRNKRMDVVVHCNARYHDLYTARHELLDTEKDTKLRQARLHSYLKRYWGLKSDQFDYWLAGYVDQETFASWVLSTADALSSDGPEGIPYRAYLFEMEAPHTVVNQRFVNLIEFLEVYVGAVRSRELKYAAILQYLRCIEKLEKRLIRQLARDRFGRVWMSKFVRTLKPGYRKKYYALADGMPGARLLVRLQDLWETGLFDGWHHHVAQKTLCDMEEHFRSLPDHYREVRRREGEAGLRRERFREYYGVTPAHRFDEITCEQRRAMQREAQR